MTKYFLIVFCLLTAQLIHAQTTIYSKGYGESKNPAIIYIHGGPRGNSNLFEGTTAKKLSEKGFYIIVYDRRGEGRSVDTSANFTFQEAMNDLSALFQKYNIKKATLIAHSFGGLVGTLFTAQKPEKVTALILTGALFSQQETYDHILNTTKKNYLEQNDQLMLTKISEIEKLPKNSAAYRQLCYEIASKNNFFNMPSPTVASNRLREEYEKSEYGRTNIRNDNAPTLFYQNEVRNNIDTKPILKKIKKRVKLFAIYGQQDQIFSKKQLNDMRNMVNNQNFKIIDNCSHYPFVDQQTEFINTIEKWIK